jgi:hypothetical protein
MTHRVRTFVTLVLAGLAVAAAGAQTQAPPKVTSPKEQFGHEIGADYVLPNYTQLTAYWQKLDKESDRMILQSIGKTAEGRDHYMAIISAPENLKKMDRYKEIARRLAQAEGLTDEQARALAAEGRAVVWIDGGLHATEVLGAQQLTELVYQMVSRTDAETTRILRDVILLAVHANPDGMELVSNWYMRESEPTRRSTGGIPRLYQKYIGHDNNRDFYMSAQPETTNMNRVMYLEWFPQIMYNHHQTGPTGTVLFAPPFRDPFNLNFDPLVPLGIDLVGAAIHGRFAAEGKAGATMRRGANYSTWFNGGLRTTSYFHNMIGILTETIGNPTPMEIPFVPQRQLASGDLPFPITPQKWHFRQSIEYSISANRAILDLASKHREDFLFNIYQMGRNSIQRGSRDTWTVWPKRLEAVQAAIARDRQAAAEGQPGGAFNPAAVVGGFAASADSKYFAMLRDPALRDPRGYIIPADQADFLTATKFVNTLMKTGVVVHRATAEFLLGGRAYPAGSYVVKTAQAFRPHVLDMFEPQDHPNDFQFPGGPPIPPYDNAGYTLAYQMGVQFDRILDGFDGPFERLSGQQKPAAGVVYHVPGATGYVTSHRVNDAFIAVNRLLKSNEDVYWLRDPLAIGAIAQGPGAMYIPAKPTTRAVLERAAAELGLTFHGVSKPPAGESYRLRPVRIGLWDQYGGSMPSGWVRWMFEQFEFPFEVVYPPTLDAGDLRKQFDVLVFVGGAIPERDGRAGGPGGGLPAEFRSASPQNIPAEFQGRVGSVTVAKTVPQLRRFVDEGGTLIAIGSSTSIARHFGLPVGNALVEKTAEGERALPRDKFYVPGSVLRAAIDNTHPVAYGMPTQADVFFDNSPVFTLDPSATLKGARAIAWFDSATPLRSGWAWGQHYLNRGIAAIEAPVGKGKVFLFGPEVTFRSQPHGTYKLFFNAIYYGPAQAVRPMPAMTSGQ